MVLFVDDRQSITFDRLILYFWFRVHRPKSAMERWRL